MALKKLLHAFFSTSIIFGAMIATGGMVSVLSATSVSADTTSKIKQGVTDSGAKSTDNTQGLLSTIKIVVNILLFIIGAIAVIMIIIAGFRMVTANGDSGTISQARNTVLYAVIGIIVAFMAFAIVNFVASQLEKA